MLPHRVPYMGTSLHMLPIWELVKCAVPVEAAMRPSAATDIDHRSEVLYPGTGCASLA